MTRRQTLIFNLLLLASSAVVHAAEQQRQPLKIIPADDGWKGASNADVKKILYSAASELWKYAYDTTLDPIIVRNGDQGPIVLYQRGDNQEYQVRLDTGQTYWSQYAFQFAHEFCHILCHYKEAHTGNLWFEETLCETASLFVLRAMEKTWEKNPPYSNWKSYRHSLYEYAQDGIDQHRLKEGENLANWYGNHAEHLKNNPTDREKNTTAATELLPLLEAHPEYWAAVRFINESRNQQPQTFTTYLNNWLNNCPDEQKPAVREIIRAFAL